ncbi:putative protein phosphatase [Armadillidium nasatum]|uniref:protein-serine/threonine phosphatase n=1 Tax=Armadillidium nasatum TaxID=96803 RepID=A0A5N5TLR8_9CRUS|nr:putative protein phosphatase [Armadillidium nasatum]
MGAYLSKPVTDKVSSDEHNEILICGASSMQGWRIYQEDAHNTCLNYDENQALFAVYDGHGGSEVAVYTAAELPEFIKKTESYKNGKYSQALTDAFLDFDSTLVESDVQAILKEIAGSKEKDDSDYDGEEVDHLCREASMPLEEVIAKYSEDGTIHFQSPNIRPRKKIESISLSENEGCSSSSLVDEVNDSSDPEDSANNSIESSSSKINSSTCSEENSLIEENSKSPNKTVEESVQISHIEENITTASLCNGLPKEVEKQGSTVKSLKEISSNSISENIKKKNLCSESDSEKSVKVEVDAKITSIPSSKEEEENQVLVADAGLVNGESSPKLFNGKIKDEGGGKENCDSSINDEKSEEDKETKYEHKEVNGKLPQITESKSGKGKGKSKGKSLLSNALAQAMKPGYDSGCTACVALLNGHDLYVANVGDSRCVVCRNGQALDMSIDHKPEDELEAARIRQAGGRITADGRVNGGLNLSRALGDHSYKQNKNHTAANQMISPLPDIQTLKLTPEDSFMVIACDGIWNSMSSQQVCDFINERLDSHKKLSTIAEEMFDHCLSPDAHGDGTGCDNMTCIIVKFSNSVSVSEKVKRPYEENELEKSDSSPQDKRRKLDTDIAE